MALYEDFDLDITTGTENNKIDAKISSWNNQTCAQCVTKCDTCADACSASCGGVSHMPCDR